MFKVRNFYEGMKKIDKMLLFIDE